MVRGHNLSIDTVAASRVQKPTSKSSLDNNDNRSSIDDDDYLTSSPSIIEEEIDFTLVYALHSFHATVEGQATVEKGDSLNLLDDSNSYWWLVKVLPSDEIGYIPAENIETPYERLARLNKHRNISLTSSQNNTESDNSLSKQISTNQVKAVTFASPLFFKVQLVSEPEELDYADQQIIDSESDHSLSNMSQENNRISKTSIQSAGSENQASQPLQARTQSVQLENNSKYDQSSRTTNSLNNKIQDVINNKNGTIKMSLTPALGSDFIDFSDEEDEINNTKTKSFEKANNNNEPIKTNITPSESIKNVDVSDDKKSGKPKKEEKKKESGGIFRHFFKRKSKKKEEEPVKQVSPMVDNTKQNNQPSSTPPPQNNAKAQRPSPLTNQQRSSQPGSSSNRSSQPGSSSNQSSPRASSLQNRSQLQQVGSPPNQNQNQQQSQKNQSPQRQIDPRSQRNQSQNQSQNLSQNKSQNQSQIQHQSQQQSPNLKQPQTQQQSSKREYPKVQQVSSHEPPVQVIQRDSGSVQQDALQVPTQDAVKSIKLKTSPSPIRVVQHTPSERSITPLTPLTPVDPFYNVIRIFAGQNISSNEGSKLILLSQTTITSTLIKQALHRFNLNADDWENQIQLMSDDLPLDVFHSLTSSNAVTLPSIRRSSIESISSTTSNLSDISVIKNLELQNDKGIITFYLNRRTKRGSRSSSERKLRVRVLIYNDDLPVHLRNNKQQQHVPRTSMSVPKHLAEKAARRRSREEGKPREKAIVVSGLSTVRQVIEKAMEKLEINDGIVDDGKRISDNDEKPRYQLMMIVDGEEKLLSSEINIISVYPTAPRLHHLSVDSVDSSSSLALDYRPDEPMFVLRLLRPEDRQTRAMPAVSEISRHSRRIQTQSHIFNKSGEQKTNDDITNTRKQLIEQQREYSREKQRSILSAHKNTSQGIDIVTKAGAIRSSRIFGAKIRYSFIPTQGKEFDISNLIEDIWGDDDEVLNSDDQSDLSFNDPYNEKQNKKKNDQYRKSTTQDVDILVKMINSAHNNNGNVIKSFEERIERVLQQVDRYSNGMIPNLATALHTPIINERSNSLSSGWSIPSPTRYNATPDDFSNDFDDEDNDSVSELYSSKYKNLPSLTIERSQSQELLSRTPQKSRQRSFSSASNNSINTNTTLDSITPGNHLPLFRKSSTASSFTDSDWILTDDFGLQELLILVRSGVNMLELKERRRSGWQIHEDPEKILSTLRLGDIRNDIREVFDNVNNELDQLEQELDQLMDDAIKVF
ncbi:6444_t:CDS:10 [Scutellospora calospora]|uniref:6444_t:CDS:1 n=1 Tax=Scutellospora calospora TaxID=85575 RepID=A0ACA9K693_9GLOM|nr:6444_t:CDS:10 [Scutellospora calospora]